MPDFIDRLGAELALAASAGSETIAERPRRRARWLRPLVIVPALVVLGAGGAVAGGLLTTGRPVAPAVRPVPTANNGTAIPSSVTLPALQVADPGGGPPWGLRTLRTTRGDVCVQAGRLADGTIGALGQDGAFADDHRFHPFSANDFGQLTCVPADARGHGFTNVVEWGLPASAMETDPSRRCVAAHRVNFCPVSEARDVYFGLLGPEAASVTYLDPRGRAVTVPTVGSQGAYLIVTRARPQSGGSLSQFAGLLRTGPIRAVTYRNGLTCRPTPVNACGPVGYVFPSSRLTRAALASPVHIRALGSTRLHIASPAPHPLRLLNFAVSFIARAAVTGTRRFYYVSLFFPRESSCLMSAYSSETSTDIRAGQRITIREQADAGCHGTVQGIVRYYPDTRLSSAPEADRSAPGTITVGRFRLRIP